jgi:hypothetical protein
MVVEPFPWQDPEPHNSYMGLKKNDIMKSILKTKEGEIKEKLREEGQSLFSWEKGRQRFKGNFGQVTEKFLKSNCGR